MSESKSPKSELGFLLQVLVMLAALVAGTFVAGAVFQVTQRPAAFVISLPLLGMLLAACPWSRNCRGLFAFLVSYALYIPVVELIRRYFAPAAFFGPFEGLILAMVYGIISGVTLTVSLITRGVFSEKFKWRFARWPIVIVMAAVPLVLGLMTSQMTIGLGPHNLLKAIRRLEQGTPNQYANQELGSMLAAVGRQKRKRCRGS